ncbi:hypothetical protein B5D80_00165 [Micromonospora wenchangensis]|uniref:Uncharacterized protein n=1 Tax=Micromonospora wenchangensis TaxID=1185415 RepID=A0A246RTK8_9ACTN|nr:hypothetical protein [Micromonospora wenchangensis]OWV13590.1 hypothetical protein B5D80_00165 [Micromonospora wenchangensis]
MTGVPTVACPDCDGTALRRDPCRCTRYGDRLLAVQAGPTTDPGGPREHYRACVLCRGAGTVTTACHRCGRQGRRRAQLVLTAANLDTGAVASRRVGPDDLDPRPDPAGGWSVDLTPRLSELAAEAGVAATVDPVTVRLPAAWRLDLPAAERHELAAQALAAAARPAWRVLIGRSVAAPPVDPARRLDRLCALADLLLLDLVVETRRHDGELRWAVRYEVPGSPVPDRPPATDFADLPAALAGTDVADALAGLTERGRDAPARMLRPDPLRPLIPAASDVARVARRLRADSAGRTGGGGLPGAQAIWRDGHWWHTALRPGEPVETLVAQPTGQVTRLTRTPLRRMDEPPDPPWLGEPVPTRPCLACRPASTCPCRAHGRPADGDCTHRHRVTGAPAGWRSALTCATCGGTGLMHQTALITLTDLRHRVVHLAWHAGQPEPVTPVDPGPGGPPVIRLPGRYRLGAWSAAFGVRPEDLAEADGGHPLPPDVREGYLALPRADADPVGEQIAVLGPALPAARLLVTAVPPAAPPLTELLRLALGLDLALLVHVLDLRRHPVAPMRAHGVLWAVDLRPPDAPIRPDDLPDRPSLAAAVAHCLECLDVLLPQTVPDDPRQPVPAPRTAPRPLPPDPVPELRRLAARHAGRPLSIRFTRAGHTVHRHDDDGIRLVSEAGDLPDLWLT